MTLPSTATTATEVSLLLKLTVPPTTLAGTIVTLASTLTSKSVSAMVKLALGFKTVTVKLLNTELSNSGALPSNADLGGWKVMLYLLPAVK